MEETVYSVSSCDIELRRAGQGWKLGRRLLLWSMLAFPLTGALLIQWPSRLQSLLLLLVPVAAGGMWFYFRLRDPRTQLGGCRLEADSEGLRVSGGRTLAWSRDELETGWPDEPSGAVVRLRSGAELAISGLTADGGAPLLQRLGLDPSRGMADFKVRGALSHLWMGSHFGRVIGVIVLISAAQLTQGPEMVSTLLYELRGLEVLLCVSLFLTCYLVVQFITWRYLFRRTALVGTDGLAITGGWSRRYIPLSAVASVEEVNGVVWLEGQDGGRVDLNPTSHFKTLRKGPASGLLPRIRWAVSHRAGGSSRAVASAVDRQGAELSAWRRDLLALAHQSGGYRTMALEPEQLMEVVWDRDRSVEARVGAAVVGSAMGGEELADKIREVASSCGNWYLRTALLLAAEQKIQEGPLQRAKKLGSAPGPQAPVITTR